MSRMKYVLDLINDGEYHNLKFEITKAKVKKQSKFTFRGLEVTIKQAEAMLAIMNKHIKANSKDYAD